MYQPKYCPEDCRDMNDIRSEIDHIDYAVIQLLSRRYDYVKAASQFKSNITDILAKERVNSILQQREQWALEQGLNGEVIKKLYADLVNYFISEEKKEFERKN